MIFLVIFFCGDFCVLFVVDSLPDGWICRFCACIFFCVFIFVVYFMIVIFLVFVFFVLYFLYTDF